jgi:hypothetical protein
MDRSLSSAEALEGVGELREPLRYQDLKRNGAYLGRRVASSPVRSGE